MIYTTGFYPPFLIGCLLLYWLAMKTPEARFRLLGAASFLFLFSRRMTGILPLVALTAVVYLSGKGLRESRRFFKLSLLVLIPLSVLLAFKYMLPLASGFFNFPEIALPVGVSYYTFKHIHYLVESSRGNIGRHGFSEYLAYIFFFPMFMAGPIERFDNFSREVRQAAFSWQSVSVGAERILAGSIKKFLIADLVLRAALPPAGLLADGAPLLEWYHVLFASFLRFLITYFDFSGYTDMVIGTGRFFGIRLMENFRYPLLAASLADFWRSWHISLTSWVRDYVYYPVLMSLRNTGVALLATMLVIGVWHDPKLGWVCWGLHHGVGLLALGRFRKWLDQREGMKGIRSTAAWRVLGTLGVWYYLSLAYSLTMTDSPRLYLKILSWGAL